MDVEAESSTSPAVVEDIWSEAIQLYEGETNTSLSQRLALQCEEEGHSKYTSPTFTEIWAEKWLEEQSKTFAAFREKGRKIRMIFKPIMEFVEKISDVAGEGVASVRKYIRDQDLLFILDRSSLHVKLSSWVCSCSLR